MASDSSLRPKLVVYKEVVEGDLRKLQAQSNDSETGGGARDLRFPYRTFRPVMQRIFAQEGFGRGGTPIRMASVIYRDESGDTKTTQLEYWPPTSSRPTEDRIAKVHKSPALGGRMPDAGRGKAFVLFILFDSGLVRVEYAYEDQLRDGVWASELASAILECIATTDRKNVGRQASLFPVQGFYEFTSGRRHCHAE